MATDNWINRRLLTDAAAIYDDEGNKIHDLISCEQGDGVEVDENTHPVLWGKLGGSSEELFVNNDFSDGITGWSSENGVIDVIDGFMYVNRNGDPYYRHCYQTINGQEVEYILTGTDIVAFTGDVGVQITVDGSYREVQFWDGSEITIVGGSDIKISFDARSVSNASFKMGSVSLKRKAPSYPNMTRPTNSPVGYKIIADAT